MRTGEFLFLSLLLSLQNAKTFAESMPSYPSIGRCDQITSEFITELESDSKNQNTSLLCEKVSACYGSWDTVSAQKLKHIYDLRCEKYKIYSFDIIECYQNILEAFSYDFESECSSFHYNRSVVNSDFTHMNSSIRSASFELAYDCVLDVANRTCSTKAYEYLQSRNNADFLLNPRFPGNESCESFMTELSRKTCTIIREEALNDWWMLTDTARTEGRIPGVNVVKNVKRCEKIQDCNNDPCNIISDVRLMKHCEVYNAAISYFYNCLKDSGSLHPVSIGSCSPTNKTCIKSTMIKECGEEGMEDFDRYYDWFNKYNINDLDHLKVKGNFSKYLVEDSLRNSPSIYNWETAECVPIVDKLVTLLSRETTEDIDRHLRITNETCGKVMNCYKSIPTKESQSLQKTYQSICDKIEFTTNDLYDCLYSFLKKQQSTEDNNYFSRNLTLKREAFLAGKEEFLTHSQEFCSRRGKKYLNSKYNEFVDLITIPPENDNCKSVFSMTENYGCMRISEETMEDFVDIRNSSLKQNIINDCNFTKKCMEGSKCPSERTTRILNWCENIKKV